MTSTSEKDRRERAEKILRILALEFPEARSALVFSDPLELLISTILSAQATDKLVNRVTASLFKKYRKAEDYAAAPIEELEDDISSVNFFRNKAKSIKKCSTRLVDEFNGSVPATLEELVSLAGVGQKTANIVLGNAYGIPALAVDTHVKRVAGRLGLSESVKPDDIEGDLTAIIDRGLWTQATHLLILHGRKTCKARVPLCDSCPVREFCEYYKDISGQG